MEEILEKINIVDVISRTSRITGGNN